MARVPHRETSTRVERARGNNALRQLEERIAALERSRGVVTEAFGFVIAAGGSFFVPFGSFAAENGTPNATHVWHVPVAGTITDVRVQTTIGSGNVTGRFRNAENHIVAEDTKELRGFDIVAATGLKVDLVYKLPVKKGDKLMLGLTFAVNVGSVLGWITLEFA